jgi:hypothetical protein
VIAASAPRGANAQAAAIAACTSLVALFPTQKAKFDAQLASALAGLTDGEDGLARGAVARGFEWGEAVAVVENGRDALRTALART